VWGKSLNSKATLKIVRHAGTSKEFEQVETIDLKNEAVVKLTLKDGRRTALASVPPPEALQSQAKKSDPARAGPGPLTQLRDLANPYNNGSKGIRGGVASMGIHIGNTPQARVAGKSKGGDVVFETSLPALTDGVGLTARLVVAPDGKSLQME